MIAPYAPAAAVRASQPVPVCFLIDRFGVGGTESQLAALIEGLDRRQFDPHLCFLDGTDELSRSVEIGGRPAVGLGVRRLRHPSTLARAWRFRRYLRAHRVRVLHAFFPDSTWFGAAVARAAGVPHVVGARRNVGYWMTARDRRRARLIARLVNVTVANCEACRQAVIEQEGARPDSVVVIANGIDLEPFTRLPQRSIPRDGRPIRVGMLANLRPVKGIDVFLRAAAILAARYPQMVFQLAGSGDEAWAAETAETCGIAPRVQFLGRVADVPAFLGELDVAVSASRSEGLSNALLEYMAAGRPMVATDVGAARELIDDGLQGLLVPPGDPDALAGAIARTVDDPAAAQARGLAARRRARESYSKEAMVRRYESFFNLLCGRYASRT